MPYCQNTLVDRDGWLYELMEYTASSEPVLIRSWYPIGIRTSDYRRNYECNWNGEQNRETRLGQQCESLGNGIIRVDGLEFRLKDGGQTRPEHFEQVPYPCPKVRKGIKTRFHNGSWEKYLKTQGWVYC